MTIPRLLPRWSTFEEKAGLKIACWVTGTGISLACWAQSCWAFVFVVCLMGTVAEVYRTHLAIKLRHARREREDL